MICTNIEKHIMIHKKVLRQNIYTCYIKIVINATTIDVYPFIEP